MVILGETGDDCMRKQGCLRHQSYVERISPDNVLFRVFEERAYEANYRVVKK